MTDDPDSSNLFTKPARYLRGVGPRKAEILAKIGIRTVGDLLDYLPRNYLETGGLTPIAGVCDGGFFKVCGAVTGVSVNRFRGRRKGVRSIVRISVRDGTGVIRAVWFNAPYRSEAARKGETVVLSGKVSFHKEMQMVSPTIEVIGEGASGEFSEWSMPVLPIYRLTDGLHQRTMRRILDSALAAASGAVRDHFPDRFLAQRRLMPLADAYAAAHRPEKIEDAENGRRRLAFDELFFSQMLMALRRSAFKAHKKRYRARITGEIDARIRRRFPFELTAGQEKAVGEIVADIEADAPMNRLLQGDVGSGKTVVALYAMLAYVANGCQAVIMAPTEILAEQHFNTIRLYLKGSRVRIALLKGGQKASERTRTIKEIAAGEIDIIAGTHALIQKDVRFARPGIVVVDEQHKFGVMQRGTLGKKGLNPDVLVMTATPIPRTLAMTVFGDLDVSTIDGMPPGRIPPRTVFVPKKKSDEAYEFIRSEISAGRQAYFVYPLIEKSDKDGMTGLKAAAQTSRILAKKVFPELKVGLLHGGMKAADKEKIMRGFRNGSTHILVSTVVIEVGIDVPNATVMVIENAERFGLSQLHQLRGRIGRGAEKSHCLLFADARSEIARRRLEIMRETSDGFRIAEEDLRLRGPGELLGTRQHGLPEMRHADPVRDFQMLVRAREDAFDVVYGKEFRLGRSKEKLSEEQYRVLVELMRRRLADKIDLAGIA